MEWINWSGGECPVDGKTKVQARFRAFEGSDEGCPAYALRWTHTNSRGDIIAYRIVEQPAQDGWINWSGGARPIDDGATVVEVRLRSGRLLTKAACDFSWQHIRSAGDIIAYRVAEQPSIEPAATAVQVGGDHYKKLGIQPIEYISANNRGFCEGNVVKYFSRWKDKNGLQDLEKAKHYIELLIEMEKKYGRR